MLYAILGFIVAIGLLTTIHEFGHFIVARLLRVKVLRFSIGFGKPLRYSLKGHRRLRVSDYRIVYRIEAEKNSVLIIAIKHRKDIYEE